MNMSNNQDYEQEERKKKGFILTENKGRGLFYGVIAIATFIVMAVGATFAYFTSGLRPASSKRFL